MSQGILTALLGGGQKTRITGSNASEGVAEYRLNQEGALLASAARTITTQTPNQTNHNARGVIIYLNITAASGTGGLQVQVANIDPVSGQLVYLNTAPTAITATGRYGYAFYPGISGGAATNGYTLNYSAILGRTWVARVVAGDATSYTYSLGFGLIL